jgi:hypothetical protein
MLYTRGPFAASFEKSLKTRGMDGPIDLFIYRPIGFVIARGLLPTGISPNAVTLFGVALGLAAGICALPGTPYGFLLCAILFQASNCFDCADGQLARMTGRYSREGRLLDGIADYAVNVFIYAGSLIGFLNAGHGRVSAPLIVLAGGAGAAISSMYYDRAINRFAKRMSGDIRDESDELEYARGRAAGARGWWRALWRAYALYLGVQRDKYAGKAGGALAPFLSDDSRKAYAQAMYPLLAVWSFAGPSARVLYFFAFAALGHIKMYFLACIALGALTGVLLIAQQVVDLKCSPVSLARD